VTDDPCGKGDVVSVESGDGLLGHQGRDGAELGLVSQLHFGCGGSWSRRCPTPPPLKLAWGPSSPSPCSGSAADGCFWGWLLPFSSPVNV